MEKYEILISFWTLITSSVISLLTIIVNIGMTLRNIKNNNKIKEYDLNKESIIKYYLPIKYELIKLESILKEDDGEYFDMFCLYEGNSQKKAKRLKILEVYKQLVEKFESKPLYFTNNQIDRDINKVYEHMLVIVLGNENMLKLDKYKIIYNIPELDGIIQNIDKYALNYETYNVSRIQQIFKKIILRLSSKNG